MLTKLSALEEKYDELSEWIADPEIMADLERWQQYVKNHAELSDVVNAYKGYKKTDKEIQETQAILADETDKEMLELAGAELEQLLAQKTELELKMKLLLLPKDPNDEKNVIMEIRAGTGGEEAALFAADLFRMYARYAESQNWKTEVLGANYTDIGGIKELVLNIEAAYIR